MLPERRKLNNVIFFYNLINYTINYQLSVSILQELVLDQLKLFIYQQLTLNSVQ